MKRYRVEFALEAREDIESSFKWGSEEWGEKAAIRWYRKLKAHTRKILSIIPLAQSLAPESEEIGREIRQLVFGRYRILFEVVGNLVKVLHVKGAYVAKEDNDLGVNE